MKFNLSTILILLGAAAEMAPDLTGLSLWLASLHVGWLTHVAHGIGVVALACGGLSRMLPKLRPALAALGLATPPGGAAPSAPRKTPE